MHTPGDDAAPVDSGAVDTEDSRVEVYITTDTSAASYITYSLASSALCGAASPDGDKLYFTEAEWDAFVLGVKDGEFDLDESGNLP